MADSDFFQKIILLISGIKMNCYKVPVMVFLLKQGYFIQNFAVRF